MMCVVKLLCCLLAVIGAIALSGYRTLFTAQMAQPHASVSMVTHEATRIPIRLLIPSIEVNAVVEQVGVLPNDDLTTPTGNPGDDVGWYKPGPAPGERGSAVIDGHLDRPGGYPAVFWHLCDVQVGDKVMVIAATGKTVLFRVRRIVLYPHQDAPLLEIFGNTGGIHLNLITCAGDWIPSQSQTTLRLVVYTSLA
jgi:sortase (surface protein transpeptidase)